LVCRLSEVYRMIRQSTLDFIQQRV